MPYIENPSQLIPTFMEPFAVEIRNKYEKMIKVVESTDKPNNQFMLIGLEKKNKQAYVVDENGVIFKIAQTDILLSELEYRNLGLAAKNSPHYLYDIKIEGSLPNSSSPLSKRINFERFLTDIANENGTLDRYSTSISNGSGFY